MTRYKAGLIIAHPEEQKWNNVWKVFRFPNLTLPTLAALMPEDEWEIEIQDELVGPLSFERDYDLVLITVTTSVSAKSYEVARRFRRTGAKVVLGGIHPSVMPGRVNRTFRRSPGRRSGIDSPSPSERF